MIAVTPRTTRPRLRGRGLALVLALALSAPNAFAHGGGDSDGSVRAVLGPLPPALDGVRVQLRRTLAPQLLVANEGERTLTVLDSDGRAFLRIGDGETRADLGAAAFHRSNTLMAPGAIPADASTKARWQTVEPEPHWGWFDLRLRTDGLDVPHAVTDGGERARLGGWSIPVRHGDTTTEISGHFEFVPDPGGIPEARIADTGALSDVALVRAMNGSARAGLFLSYRGERPLTVRGALDEPLLRFDADGVAVNRHSPTWQDIAPAGAPDYAAGDGVDWARISGQPSYGWIDPRAGFTGSVTEADEATVVKRWTIPIRVGETESAIEGVTEWKPVAPVARAH
ncbi:hypothetical protein SAOR_09250 [Salinisphaera orenii MK-B5]|uniref:Uncharacterized protein n=1 Tax=Salinisphaera orenii MK-B5 TaxID=856730 RepID=A0A423PNN4_9GAMM|nr:hypothetical protein SAOR_09250 [Salinisphaera orenii MK-B5]